ncbi:hypothetical protein HN51_061740, partial [Arachis hypogaea]
MAKTKNAKRARVEGESSASARLVASSHYMARWLPSPRTLNNLWRSSSQGQLFLPIYHGTKFTGGIAADEEWGEYNRLVGLQSLQYENPHMGARGNQVQSVLETNRLKNACNK